MPAQQQPHPGFNNQLAFDPFLASNCSDENLVAVPSEYTPSHYSQFSPTPEPALKANGAQSVRATSEGLNGHTPQEDLSEGYRSPPSHLNDEEWNDTISSFLSPQDLSDTGYNASSEHTETPEDNPFYYDQQLADLGPANQTFTIGANPHLEKNGSVPNSATSGPSESRTHRYSTGTATLSSSHLMSPVLTDDQAPPTRNATSSPPAKLNLLKTEPLSNSNSNFVNQVPQYNPLQHTPPMTESSENTSPDMLNSGQNIARAPSPMIRVDQYARGDSPARQDQIFPRTIRRRGGSASSLLSVQATFSDDEDEENEQRVGRGGGLDPISREQIGDASVPNFQDQEDDQQRQFKKADVEEWIARNAPVSEPPSDIPPEKPREIGGRRRARSAGAQRLSKANLESLQTTPVDQHIPGPGLLIDEESGEEESSDEEGSEPSIFDEPIAAPTPGMNDRPGEARPGVYDELPNQPALYRAKLWQDPLYDSSDPGVKLQPLSSNEAMKRFEERNRDIETVSRVATWGTRRKSDSDMASLFRRFTMASVKEDEEPEDTNKQRDRSGSIFQRLRPRRNSTLRRKESKKQKESTDPKPPFVGSHSRTSSQTSRHDSLSVPKPVSSTIKRMSSLKRPKSPRLDTESAVAAMANPLAAMGKSGPRASDVASPTGPFATAKNVLKRSRSRSELHRNDSKQSSHLVDLWNQVGGPPVATLKTEEPDQMVGEDDDDDDDADDPGIKMDLSVRYDPIIPTLDGFRDNIKSLNPRLPRYMIERVAHEQLRRYKKLLDFKVSHVKVVTNNNCPSKSFCMDLNGEPRYFENRTKKEPEVPQGGFSVSGIGPSDEDVNALQDGVVTQAQFPNGIPMPPIKRLPAEFECSLCYKVKKFQKPSDWSKHVHEDVQPFTCTFKHCADPKSFKRKADWVRHENERHRQLEWWQCTIADCNHKCYRKDNFVQHLVREHKLPEPKYKTVKTGKPAVRGPSAQKARKQAEENTYDESDKVWQMVETCKHDTTKNPKDEPCVFCGNVCNSWKKLTVHLAKHMEQVSMPVLLIVKDRQVTPDTIISPIENIKITSEDTSLSPVDTTMEPHTQFPFSTATGQALPAGFTSPSTYTDAQYPRTSPLTYPLPANHQTAYPSYSHPGHGGNNPFPDQNPHSFNPQSFPPTSSPDDIYNLPTTSQAYTYVQHTDAYTTSPPEQAAMYNNPFGGPAASGSIGTRASQPTSYPQPTGPSGQMYGQSGYQQPQNNGQGAMGYHHQVDHPMQGYGGGSEEGGTGGYVQPTGPQGFGYQ